MDIAQKTIIVTGGSGAIGGAISRHLAALGARVVVHFHSHEEAAEAVVADIVGDGGIAEAIGGDLRSTADAESLASEASRRLGNIFGLVCTAGSTAGAGTFGRVTGQDWRDAIEANLLTAVYAAQAVIPQMAEAGTGRIVFTSSVRGLPSTGREGIVTYSAAKAALTNLTSTLAKELGPNILVNAVAPGFVWTPNYESMAEEALRGFTEATVLKRFIEPSEIADCYAFLLRTDVITGQTLIADGGFTLKLA